MHYALPDCKRAKRKRQRGTDDVVGDESFTPSLLQFSSSSRVRPDQPIAAGCDLLMTGVI